MTQVTLLLSGVASLVWGFRAALFPGQCDLGGESPCSQSLHPIHPCLSVPSCLLKVLDSHFTALFHAFTVPHQPVSGSLAVLYHPSLPHPLQLYFHFLSVIRPIELGWKSLPTWPAWRGPPISLPSPSPGHTMALLTLWIRNPVVQMLRAYLTKLRPGDVTLSPDPACSGQPWPPGVPILINTPLPPQQKETKSVPWTNQMYEQYHL